MTQYTPNKQHSTTKPEQDAQGSKGRGRGPCSHQVIVGPHQNSNPPLVFVDVISSHKRARGLHERQPSVIVGIQPVSCQTQQKTNHGELHYRWWRFLEGCSDCGRSEKYYFKLQPYTTRTCGRTSQHHTILQKMLHTRHDAVVAAPVQHDPAPAVVVRVVVPQEKMVAPLRGDDAVVACRPTDRPTNRSPTTGKKLYSTRCKEQKKYLRGTRVS